MDWSEILNIVMKLFVFPVVGILLGYFVKFIKLKADELIAKTDSEVLAKYIRMAQDTIGACVVATNQTFVDALKQAGTFDKEAQKEAFRRTKEAILAILGEDAILYLTNLVGDLDTYLDTAIEAQVKVNRSYIPGPDQAVPGEVTTPTPEPRTYTVTGQLVDVDEYDDEDEEPVEEVNE